MTLRELAARWHALADCRASCLSLAKLATAIADEFDKLRAELDAPAECTATEHVGHIATVIRDGRADTRCMTCGEPRDVAAEGARESEPVKVRAVLSQDMRYAEVFIGETMLCRVCRIGGGVWLEKPGTSEQPGCGQVMGYTAEGHAYSTERDTEAQRAIAEAVAELRAAANTSVRVDSDRHRKRALAALERVRDVGDRIRDAKPEVKEKP